MLIQRLIPGSVLFFVLMLSAVLPAQASAPQGPRAVVTDTANELLAIIEEAKGYFEQEPQRFYDNVERILEPAVDMRRFAAGVMAKYYRVATREQRRRFLEVFKDSMIRTYAKGLLAFSNEEIRVLDARAPSRDPDRESVEMEVIAVDGTVYPIIYSMRRGKDDQWRITNVTVNGINLGLTFRNQFDSAMQVHNRDFDYVIDNWLKGDSDPVISSSRSEE